MSDLARAMSDLLSDHQQFRCGFQIDQFVVGGAGHPWAQYQQASREVASMFDGLKAEHIELETARLNLDEVEERDDWETLKKRRKALQRAKYQLRIDILERRMKDRIVEFRHAFGRAAALKASLGPLTPETKKRLDREAWVFATKRRAAIETIAQGGPSTESVESLFLLPAEDRDEILKFLEPNEETQLRLLSWARSVTGSTPPSLDDQTNLLLPSEEEIRRLAGCP